MNEIYTAFTIAAVKISGQPGTKEMGEHLNNIGKAAEAVETELESGYLNEKCKKKSKHCKPFEVANIQTSFANLGRMLGNFTDKFQDMFKYQKVYEPLGDAMK